MSQPKEKQTQAAKRKRYSSVPEMVRDLSEDRAFAEEVEKKIRERNLVDFLMALRTSAGLSQKDIANKMGCTQSRISKLENGKDDDLRIGDFHAYADALGLQLMILLTKKGRPPIAERIKRHTSALKRLFTELSEMVGDDGAMNKAMMKLVCESTVTLAKGLSEMLKHVAQKSPQPSGDAPSPIQIEMQEDEAEASCDADDTGNAFESGQCETACQG
jgi:transcriptional regulator with XRE-family HTH domain